MLVYFLARRTRHFCLFWTVLAILSQIYALLSVIFTGITSEVGPKLTNISFAWLWHLQSWGRWQWVKRSWRGWVGHVVDADNGVDFDFWPASPRGRSLPSVVPAPACHCASQSTIWNRMIQFVIFSIKLKLQEIVQDESKFEGDDQNCNMEVKTWNKRITEKKQDPKKVSSTILEKTTCVLSR